MYEITPIYSIHESVADQGGAGEGGGFLKGAATATASTSQVFEYWAASLLAVYVKETNQLCHVNNDVII